MKQRVTVDLQLVQSLLTMATIIEARDACCAVLLVSTELDEVLSVSDRVAVMYRGEILATLPAAEATRERVGLLMAGIKQTAAA